MKYGALITITTSIIAASAVYATAQDTTTGSAPAQNSLAQQQGVVTKPALSADMIGANGQAAGKVTVTEAAKGIIIRVEAAGLSPGWHGVHVHGIGVCDSDKDFEGAGSHATHEGDVHGFMNANANHTGDLPNLWVHDDGTGQAEYYSTLLTVQAIQDNDGSAILIHADPDDYSGQPAGTSGALQLNRRAQ